MAYSDPPRKSFAREAKGIDDTGEGNKPQRDNWLAWAKLAHETSTTFIDSNYRSDWEDSIRHFQNKHMKGSKYASEAYKYRSKGFRPKTRSTVRQAEAATAAAFFSQLEVISTEPDDDSNPIQRASAALRHAIINRRLTDGKIPWFVTCVGGMQSAEVMGVVASKQYWEFEEEMIEVPLQGPDGQPALDALTGEIATDKVPKRIKDHPMIELRPIENLRFDPAADWTDPVNSSPYFIDMQSMFVGDVRAKMESGEWTKVDDNLISQAKVALNDTTRVQREGEKDDSTESRQPEMLKDFDTVWVHENFMRKDGKEYHYYTLGTVARLTKARPLKEVYLHGIRPHVIGSTMIEPHRVMPDSAVHLAKPLQKDANEIRNSRRDNVLLVLNKRHYVRRGKQVDIQSLVRNAPGSVTLMTDPEKDVISQEFNDVTGSSFAEEDRNNLDLDELLGSFSQGSVQSNRKLNETVGGLKLLAGSSNNMTQYLIRVFSETWVEKVVRQIDLLEQYYEDNVEFLALMAKRANLKRFGLDPDQIPPGAQDFWKQLLMQPATITVNVSNSAMDPAIRLSMFLEAVAKYTEIAQTAPQDLDREKVKEQIFGMLGYRDGSQFSIDAEENPQVAALMQQVQQLQQVIESKQAEQQAKDAAALQKAEMDKETKELQIAQKEREDQRRIESEERQNALDRHLQLILAGVKDATENTKIAASQKPEVTVIDSKAKAGIDELAESVKTVAQTNQALIQQLGQVMAQAANTISKALEDSRRIGYRVIEDDRGQAVGIQPVQ